MTGQRPTDGLHVAKASNGVPGAEGQSLGFHGWLGGGYALLKATQRLDVSGFLKESR
jgi:hypothetical protein